MKEFNGYSFEDKEVRKRMKYLVVEEGSSDINNTYAFKNKKDLKAHLKSEGTWRETWAVFKIEDVTSDYL